MSPKDFILKYRPFALTTQEKTGISHLFILAQAALESGWGTHAPGNMFFGIKAPKNTPEHLRQLLKTTEVLPSPDKKNAFPEVLSISERTDGKFLYIVRDWFRKYNSPEESFTHHAQLLSANKRYAPAMLHKDDPYRLAREIANAGYATDPNYAQKLQKIISLISQNLWNT